jgi:hypothetical protein
MLTAEQEAWDSYIQNGNTIDTAFQFQHNTEGQQPDQSGFGNSVFMGANTPGR